MGYSTPFHGFLLEAWGLLDPRGFLLAQVPEQTAQDPKTLAKNGSGTTARARTHLGGAPGQTPLKFCGYPPIGYGPKLNHPGTAGFEFNLLFHLPGQAIPVPIFDVNSPGT